MKRPALRITLGLAFLAVAAAGFIPWNVTGPARWVGRRLIAQKPGGQFTLGKARWVPWEKLELRDLRVQFQPGGWLHFARVNLEFRSCAFAEGRWVSRWEFGEIRLDSSTLGIPKSVAMEILPAGPAVNRGFAVLEVDRNHWKLKELALQGANLDLSFGKHDAP